MATVDRTVLFAAVSVASGIGMAAVKFGMGVMAQSLLFIVSAIYYAILCVTRLAIVNTHRHLRNIEDSIKRLHREMNYYRNTGLFLALIGLTYAAFSLTLLFVPSKSSYTNIMAITVATITVVKIGTAIRGLIVSRHEKNPMDSAIKFISFTDALLSIVVMQNVLLVSQHSPAASQSSGLFGIGLSLAIVVVGMVMFLHRHAGKSFELKAQEEAASTHVEMPAENSANRA